MKDRKNPLSLIVMLAVGCVMFILCGTVWDLFGQTEMLPTIKVVADSATVVAALYLGMSLLGWIGSKGTFDIFGYSIGGLFRLFSRDAYEKRGKTFYDYRTKKDENRKPFNWPMFMVGLLFLIVAAVATTAFMLLE